METENMDERYTEQPSEANETEDNGVYMSEAEFRRRVEDIQSGWRRQGDMIKNLDSSFDLEKAFEDPEFYDAIVNKGKTVINAYSELYYKTPRRSISEIGNLTNGVCPSASHDIESMSDREFDDYIKKIKNS